MSEQAIENKVDIYTQATQLAMTLGQVLKDGSNEYYLTLRQLESISQRLTTSTPEISGQGARAGDVSENGTRRR